MIKNYIFTVTAGRSGQATLHKILLQHSKSCLSAFEEPQINTIFSGFIGQLEHNFRRKFIETDELLGRGKVLTAYNTNNYQYIKKVVYKRLSKIEKLAEESQYETYFDISKFYARGLYQGFNSILDKFSVILLVRDPLLNMISFLNREKNFFLDNSRPNVEVNLLKLDFDQVQKGELYLWAWCEMFLRFKKIIKSKNNIRGYVLKSEDLNSPLKVSKMLSFLNVKHSKINHIQRQNTNLNSGFNDTDVGKKDLKILENFVRKIPKSQKMILLELEKSLDFHKLNLN